METWRVILFIMIGFVAAYFIQELRLQRNKKNAKKNMKGSLERIKTSILKDLSGALGKRDALKIADNAVQPESRFCCPKK